MVSITSEVFRAFACMTWYGIGAGSASMTATVIRGTFIDINAVSTNVIITIWASTTFYILGILSWSTRSEIITTTVLGLAWVNPFTTIGSGTVTNEAWWALGATDPGRSGSHGGLVCTSRVGITATIVVVAVVIVAAAFTITSVVGWAWSANTRSRSRSTSS